MMSILDYYISCSMQYELSAVSVQSIIYMSSMLWIILFKGPWFKTLKPTPIDEWWALVMLWCPSTPWIKTPKPTLPMSDEHWPFVDMICCWLCRYEEARKDALEQSGMICLVTSCLTASVFVGSRPFPIIFRTACFHRRRISVGSWFPNSALLLRHLFGHAPIW